KARTLRATRSGRGSSTLVDKSSRRIRRNEVGTAAANAWARWRQSHLVSREAWTWLARRRRRPVRTRRGLGRQRRVMLRERYLARRSGRFQPLLSVGAVGGSRKKAWGPTRHRGSAASRPYRSS